MNGHWRQRFFFHTSMSINQAINIQTTTLNAITPTTGVLSIGDTQTTGVLNVGTGVRTAAGVMNIATGTSNDCPINIMNGSTTGGSVNIANGTGASQTTAVNIGSGSTTGTVTIGNTANTTNLNSGITNIRGTLGVTGGIAATGMITANGGLTMGGSNNITLGNGSVKPTSANLGFVVTTTAVNTAAGTGFNKVILNATMNYFSSGITLSAGSWIITYSVQMVTNNATINYCFLYNTYVVSGTTSTLAGTFIGGQVFTTFDKTVAKVGFPLSSNGDYRPAGAGTVIVSPTTSTTYNVQGFISTLTTQVGTVQVINSVLSAIRIA